MDFKSTTEFWDYMKATDPVLSPLNMASLSNRDVSNEKVLIELYGSVRKTSKDSSVFLPHIIVQCGNRGKAFYYYSEDLKFHGHSPEVKQVFETFARWSDEHRIEGIPVKSPLIEADSVEKYRRLAETLEANFVYRSPFSYSFDFDTFRMTWGILKGLEVVLWDNDTPPVSYKHREMAQTHRQIADKLELYERLTGEVQDHVL